MNEGCGNCYNFLDGNYYMVVIFDMDKFIFNFFEDVIGDMDMVFFFYGND